MQEKMILLVEDNPDDEFLILRELKKSNLKNRIEVVRDGQEALDFIFYEGKYSNRDKEIPQVVLLDIKLPKVDGLEVLRKVRSKAETKTLPIVILTSSAEESDLVAGYAGGANSYIVKPLDMEQFRKCVAQLQLYWVLLNEPPRK
jgi:two-component system, response regulator